MAAALGYTDPKQAVRRHVDDEDKEKLGCFKGTEMVPLLKHNEMLSIFISESGLYSLITNSKKPEAKAFKRWVTCVVLPRIRTSGSYSVCKEPLIPALLNQGPSGADMHSSRLARLHAIKAAKEVADQWGFIVSDDLGRHAMMAVNEVLLPPGWDQKDMIDAAEYLRRRGHTSTEIQHMSSEFGGRFEMRTCMQGRNKVLLTLR